MIYTPKIYDWRSDLVPSKQVFLAGGMAGAGGMTLGGAAIINPEPGGRGALRMEFATLHRFKNLDASWTYSRVMNGSIMRVPLFRSPQLVDAAALGGAMPDGVPWSNDQPWATGQNWAWSPTAPVTVASAKGSVVFSADLSAFGPVLRLGHVIGFHVDGFDFSHKIMDLEYVGNTVTAQVSPPLRRALTTDVVMAFRPKMLVTCQSPDQLAGSFGAAGHTTPGAAVFVEALV